MCSLIASRTSRMAALPTIGVRDDPVLRAIARIVHEADLEDER
jgi:hypothetical protein